MIITETPLRISFAGGGTDLPEYYRDHGGRIVSCAIDKYIYVIAKQRYDDAIYVNYSKKEIVSTVDEIEHGLVREGLKLAGVSHGIEITTLADIPSEGSGLGSSSSVTVGLLNALHLYKGTQLSAKELAEQACEIELIRLNKAMGKQDSYIAAYGGLREFHFGPDDATATRQLPLEADARREFERRLMMFYTGITRKANPILEEQRAGIEDRLVELGSLRDLAGELADEFDAGRIDSLGRILRAGWEAKGTLAEGVSTGAIETMINDALAAGADGAKVCGAGGGGFVLVDCAPEYQAAVRTALGDYRELPVRISGTALAWGCHRPSAAAPGSPGSSSPSSASGSSVDRAGPRLNIHPIPGVRP